MRPLLLRASFVAGVVLLSGCAATLRSAPGCTAEGGLVWRELQSDHFLVRTDLGSSAARKTLTDLEHYRAAILSAFGSSFDPPGRLEVYVVRSKGDLAELADPRLGGFAHFSSGKPTLVLSGQSFAFDGPALPEVVGHELAHYLSRFVLLRQPRWFAEGLASYLSTIELKDDGRAVIGRPSQELLSWFRFNAPEPLANLWQWDRRPDVGSATDSYYRTSYLYVLLLLSDHKQRLADFMGRLAKAEEPLQAWRAAFAGVRKEQTSTELEFFRHSKAWYDEKAIRLELAPVAPSERELPPVEVHLAWARLLEIGPREIAPEERARQVIAELDRALGHDPGFVPVIAERARATHDPDALRVARKLSAAHPEDVEALRFLSDSLAGDPAAAKEQVAVLGKAVALSQGTDPELLNRHAWFLALEGLGAEALSEAQKAVALAPWSAPILDTYAVVLATNHLCADAVAVQGRAIEVLPEGASASDRKRYAARLRDISERCQPD